jgi:competence protein ComEC
MRSGTIAFALGVLAVHGLATLPDIRYCWSLPALVFLAVRWPRLRLPALVAIGALWALWRASLLLADALPRELEGQTVSVIGAVVDLPERNTDRTRFRFRVDAMELGARRWPGCGFVRLDWRGTPPPAVAAGERWRLRVRLKRPHGLSNPGGFDYEAWLFQQRIRATGYVVAEGRQDRRGHERAPVDTLRAALRDRLQDAIGDDPLSGIVMALAIGTREGIEPTQWQVFSRTNTGHLIAISGLHIGLLAAFGFFLGRWLWSLPGYTVLWIPAPRVASLCAVIAATAYCAISGFEVPAQRTLIMITVIALSLWRGRRAQPLDTLMHALAAVLLVDPLAVMTVGFWLSFVAVAILMYGGGDGADTPWWRRYGRVHVAMSVGLAPLLVVFFSQHPLVGPLANLLAVPWVSFVVVPLTLAGTILLEVLPFAGYWLLRGALLALELAWRALQPLAAFDWASLVVPYPSLPVAACAGIGAIILLAPRGLPARALGLVWMAPLFLQAAPRPQPGEFWLTVLDVGQGLGSVVQTHTRTLVFDTGPVYSDRFDTGDAVIVPYLHHGGVTSIDRMVVSHGDIDHSGGAESVLKRMAVASVMSSEPLPINHARVTACRDGQSWVWDNVEFRLLSPSAELPGDDNDASCVLSVRGRAGGVLLTGDIEAGAESALLERHATALRHDVMVAPHHGSASSSTQPFIAAVQPRFVVFPVGYRNRWRFPAAAVVERYRRVAAEIYRTDTDGAVTLRIEDAGITAERFRREHRRFWNEM